jgi:septum formation protein
MESLLLASGSPRRRELLNASGIPFDSIVPDLDETSRDSLAPAERVLALAEDKAKAVAKLAGLSSPRLVLAADTLVCLPLDDKDGAEQALGKPEDEEDARRMLLRLAGRSHIVRTGLALLDRTSGAIFAIRSDSIVRFATMDAKEIEAYLSSGEWKGAAGAYRIQGLAAFFIDRLEGSWTGVVGLPMQELYVILKKAGYRLPSFGMGSSKAT